ncbi:MAG: KH domain-containing protein [Asgard group archaeon]|nr:KH domain-containing protein [Asgard group archaeon]
MRDCLSAMIDSVVNKDLILLKPEKVGSYVGLALVFETFTLRQILGNLLSMNSVSMATNEDSTIRCKRNLLNSLWEVVIDNCHVSIITSLISILMKIENRIRLMGSVVNSVQLKGDYKSGMITCYPTNIDQFIKSILNCKSHTSFKTILIDSASQLRPVNRIVPPSEPSAYVTTTLTLPVKQVSAILGPRGSILNSIRLQSKCWIKVHPSNHSPFISTKQSLQQVQITGAKENISIALIEIDRICGTFVCAR